MTSGALPPARTQPMPAIEAPENTAPAPDVTAAVPAPPPHQEDEATPVPSSNDGSGSDWRPTPPRESAGEEAAAPCESSNNEESGSDWRPIPPRESSEEEAAAQLYPGQLRGQGSPVNAGPIIDRRLIKMGMVAGHSVPKIARRFSGYNIIEGKDVNLATLLNPYFVGTSANDGQPDKPDPKLSRI
ncbi:hypothetical protein ScPMuIL_004191 [Solemya velum]